MRNPINRAIPTAKVGADPRAVERAFADLFRGIEINDQADVVVETPRRLMLRSPDGHYWALTVSNAGALGTVDMGTSL